MRVREALGHSETAIGVQQLGTKLRLVTACQRLTVCPLGTTRDRGPESVSKKDVALLAERVSNMSTGNLNGLGHVPQLPFGLLLIH